MRLVKAALVCAALAGSAAAFPALAGDDAALFRGTVGQHPIVMRLDVAGEQVSGTYFYAKFKQDIGLQGTVDQQGYELTAEATGDRFSLNRTRDGFKGKLTTAKGTQLPVRLSAVRDRLADPEPGLQFRKALSDYNRLKLEDVRLFAGKTETVGKRVIQSYTESLSGISLFHVVEGYPAAAMNALNLVIDRDFYLNLSYFFSCAGEGGKGSGAEITLGSRFLNDRLVSYSIQQNLSCQETAHPSYGFAGTTIDARTGRELALKEVWPLGAAGKPAPDAKGAGDSDDEDFARAVIPLFKKLYPQQIKSSDDGCDYADPGAWEVVSWYVSDDGLHLSPFFSGAARPCSDTEWAIVPNSVLKKDNPALFAN